MEQIQLSEGWMLVLVGALLLTGYAAHLLGARLHVPRVTLLIILGILCGPYVLNLVPSAVATWFSYVAHFALAMVGFLLGEAFVGRERIRQRFVLLPLTKVLLAAALVFLATFAIEFSLVTSLILAGIAPSSAPAATVDVLRENHAAGRLTQTVLRVVAIDDAFGIVLFSLLFAAAEGASGQRLMSAEILVGLQDILGAVVLGVVLGWPMAWLTGRLRKGEPAILEAAGFVFLCGGLATLLEVSYLLACMVLGIVVAKRAKHHVRPFHAIEGASDPFLTVFFLLAGFHLQVDALADIGLLGIVYILSRAAGLVTGGRLGAKLAGEPLIVQQHIGWCLFPQAGVALGLALLAAEKLPDVAEGILPLVIASTVVFEIVGPLFTQRHLRLAGELHRPGVT